MPIESWLELIQIQASPQSGLAPLHVAFQAVPAAGDLPADLAVDWQFDGVHAAGNAPQIEHSFDTPGTYAVTACMSSQAAQGMLCRSITIVAESQPQAPGPNTPPTAFASTLSVEYETPITITLGAADPELGELEFVVVSPPSSGLLNAVRKTGSDAAEVTYHPASGYSGLDEFTFRVGDGTYWSEPAAVSLVVLGPGTPAVLGGRTPQWPLKTQRVLYSDAQIASVRQLCQTDEGAGYVKRWLIDNSSYWITKSNQELRAMIPDSRVWRAADLSVPGCPIHGTAVYTYGTYPWILDRTQPFRVRCPVGGESYPSNDFNAYYSSSLRDPRFKGGAYPDEGRGWVSPSGDRYSFVPYAVFWHWYTTWKNAVYNLSRAYVVTGERIYAEKAIALLDRMAEVYPDMDYGVQFAEPTASGQGGKAIFRIWECTLAREWAVAYDLVWDALVSPNPVVLPWRSSQDIRANIEANLLEEIIDAVGRDQIRGNYTLHQTALAYTVAVRQHGPTTDTLTQLLNNTGPDPMDEGLDYALYNHFTKDGFPPETAPGYNFIPVSSFMDLAPPLSPLGYDLPAHPKMKSILDGPLSLICLGKFTPNLGDAEPSINAGWIGPTVNVYAAAFQRFGDPKFAWAVSQMDDLNYSTILSFDGLFEPALVANIRQASAQYVHQPTSRFMDGYGLAIINNTADTTALSAYYGIRGVAHGHKDQLGVELYANGRRVAPDLGYPDFMNDYTPSIQGWTQNTVSHNCVLVDDQAQTGNSSGRLLRFHDGPDIRFMDMDGPSTYYKCDTYRRSLLMVDAGPNASYLVDVFRVRGGSRHVLSLHGIEGAFSLAGTQLSAPVTQGTLAGANVAYGQIYDDPILGAPGYSGTYSSYRGSGYQYLFNWQQADASALTTASWQATSGPAGLLRVHMPPYPGQQLTVADAYVSPLRKIPDMLKYALLRRDVGAAGSTFAVVWELTNGTPFIDSVEWHDTSAYGSGCDEVAALTVKRGDVTDTIAVAPRAGLSYSFASALPSQGTWTSDAVAWVISEQAGQCRRRFAAGGNAMTCSRAGLDVSVSPTITGNITQADYAAKTITLVNPGVVPAADLVGRTVRVYNLRHSCAYRISAAQTIGSDLLLTLSGSDVFTGKIRVDSVNAQNQQVATLTSVTHWQRLPGMTLVSADFAHRGQILTASPGYVMLSASAAAFVPGQDAWIVDFGIGDSVEIEGATYAAQ